MELQSVPLPPLSEATRASLEAVRRAQEAARERARRETVRARIGAGMVVGVIVAGVIVLGPSLKRRLNAARAATTSPASLVAAPARVTAAPAAAPVPVAPAAEAPAAPAVATAEPTGLPGQALLAPDTARAAKTTGGDVDSAKCAETFAQHRWQISIDECTRVFEARPTDATLALRIAHAHHARGHFADAGVWANRAIGLDPTLAEGFVLVARAEHRAGHPAAAVQAYRQYLTLAPRGWHAAEARAAVRASGKAPHARLLGGQSPASVQVATRE